MSKMADAHLRSEIVRPEVLGWLRRPELDHGDSQAFEKPDDKIHLFRPGHPAELLIMVAEPITKDTRDAGS